MGYGKCKETSSKNMTVTMQKYYNRSLMLLLPTYKKLKYENKQSCDIILLYNDDLSIALLLKEHFYDFVIITLIIVCIEKKSFNGFPKRKSQDYRNLRNNQLLIEIGQNKSCPLLNIALQTDRLNTSTTESRC